MAGPRLERHRGGRGRRGQGEARVEVHVGPAREAHDRAALRVGERRAGLGRVVLVERALAHRPVHDLDGLDGVGALAARGAVHQPPVVERGRGAGVGGGRGDARVDGRGRGAGVGGRGRAAVAVHARRAATADPAAAAAVVAVLGQVDAGAAAEHQALAADDLLTGVGGGRVGPPRVGGLLRTAVGRRHAGDGDVDVRGAGDEVGRAGGGEDEREGGAEDGAGGVLHGGVLRGDQNR